MLNPCWYKKRWNRVYWRFDGAKWIDCAKDNTCRFHLALKFPRIFCPKNFCCITKTRKKHQSKQKNINMFYCVNEIDKCASAGENLCRKYYWELNWLLTDLPAQIWSWMAMIIRYTPMRKSDTARFVRRQVWTGWSSRLIRRQTNTARFPRTAKTPSSQMLILGPGCSIMRLQPEMTSFPSVGCSQSTSLRAFLT